MQQILQISNVINMGKILCVWIWFLLYIRQSYCVGFNKTCSLQQTITFGQSCAMTGPASALGIHYNAGIRAAFKEINDEGGVRGVFLNLTVLDDKYEPGFAIANTNNFTSDPNIFALLGEVGTPTSKVAVPISNAARVPFIGAFTGPSLLRSPFQRYVINFRASYIDETATMVEHLVKVENVTQIALLIQNDSFGGAGKEGVEIALKSNNMYIHSEGRYERNTMNIQKGIDAINAKDIKPEAIIMIGTYAPLAKFVWEAKKLWPNIFFLTVSFVGSKSFANNLYALGQINALTNVIVTQVVPLPTNTTIPVVARYQKALTKVEPAFEPGFVSLEGYLVGRLVVSAIERIRDNYSRESFLDAIFDSGSFNFDGFRCGPLMPEDVYGGCNQCMRAVMPTIILSNKTYSPLASAPITKFETCGYKARKWISLKFGHTTDISGPSKNIGSSYLSGIKAAFKVLNDAGGLRGLKLEVIPIDDGGNVTLAEQNIKNLSSRSDIYGLIGSVGVPSIKFLSQITNTKLPYIGALSGDKNLRHPFNRNYINLRGSSADEAGAIVQYLYTKRNIRKISLLRNKFDTSTYQGIKSALGSKRLKLFSEVEFDSSDTMSMEKIVNIIVSQASSPPEAIILLGAYSPISNFIVEAKKVWLSTIFVCLSATDSTSLVNILKLKGGINFHENIIVSQTVPVPTEDLPLISSYQSALTALDKNLKPGFTSLEGFMVGQLIISSLSRVQGDESDSKNFLKAIFETGSYNFGGIQCGPFKEEKEGICNQCMRDIWLVSILENGSFKKLRQYSMKTCEYVPEKNVDFQLSSIRLIFVILAIIANIMAIATMVLLKVYRTHFLIASSFRFSMVTLMGIIIWNSTIFVMYPIPTDATCTLEPWVSSLGFGCTFGPLFAKTRRISIIFNNKKLRKLKITDRQVLTYFLYIILLIMANLTLWTSIANPKLTEQWTLDGVRYEGCASTYEIFQYCDKAIQGLLLLWGCLLCYRVHDVKGEYSHFNESKQIGICIYNTTFLRLVLALIQLVVKEPNVLFMANSIVITIITSTVILALMFSPIRYAILKVNAAEFKANNASSSTTTKKKVYVVASAASQH